MAEQFVRVREAAERLGIHPQTVREWLRSGKLRGRLIGGNKSGWRIPETEINRLLAPEQLELPREDDRAKKLAA